MNNRVFVSTPTESVSYTGVLPGTSHATIYASAPRTSVTIFSSRPAEPVQASGALKLAGENAEWLRLAQSAFSFWDNDLDAEYDNYPTGTDRPGAVPIQ